MKYLDFIKKKEIKDYLLEAKKDNFEYIYDNIDNDYGSNNVIPFFIKKWEKKSYYLIISPFFEICYLAESYLNSNNNISFQKLYTPKNNLYELVESLRNRLEGYLSINDVLNTIKENEFLSYLYKNSHNNTFKNKLENGTIKYKSLLNIIEKYKPIFDNLPKKLVHSTSNKKVYLMDYKDFNVPIFDNNINKIHEISPQVNVLGNLFLVYDDSTWYSNDLPYIVVRETNFYDNNQRQMGQRKIFGFDYFGTFQSYLTYQTIPSISSLKSKGFLGDLTQFKKLFTDEVRTVMRNNGIKLSGEIENPNKFIIDMKEFLRSKIRQNS